jgi:hypothetical protein
VNVVLVRLKPDATTTTTGHDHDHDHGHVHDHDHDHGHAPLALNRPNCTQLQRSIPRLFKWIRL